MENQIDRSQEMQATLKEFGTYIQQERLQKGYRIEDITTYLKISPQILKAIEEGDIFSLPHIVYTKGFIRSYAQFLGIGEHKLESLFHNIDGNETSTVEEEEEYALPRRHSVSPIWIIAIVCIGLFTGLWFYRHDLGLNLLESLNQSLRSNSTTTTTTTKVKTPEHTETSSVPIVSLTDKRKKEKLLGEEISLDNKSDTIIAEPVSIDTTLEATTPKQSDQVEKNPVQKEEKNRKNESNQLSNGSSSKETVSKNDTTTELVHINKPGRKNIVILKGLEECWVHSTADTTETRQFYVQQGQMFALSFSKNLVLKLGNAGGVELKYNGEKLPPVGRSGQVKTITLPLISAKN